MPVFPRFEIVRFEVEARFETRRAEVEAKVKTFKYVVVAWVEVAKFEVRRIKVDDAVSPARKPTRVEVGVR